MSRVYYVAEHPNSGKALFSSLDDARTWAEYQHDYHRQSLDDEEAREAEQVRWQDGGHHGWHALVSAANLRKTYANVTELRLDAYSATGEED